MTATQAARSFSDVLDRVASGEVVEITPQRRPGRGDRSTASPPASGGALRALIASAPVPDDAFAAALIEARASIGAPDEPRPS